MIRFFRFPLLIPILLLACANPATSPPLQEEGVVVTFRVADVEEYKIRLTDPADIEIARRLLAGEEAPGIPIKECIVEKNSTLIRYDIIQSLRNLYNAVSDENIKAKALELIETEEDTKYRKKYASLWRNK